MVRDNAPEVYGEVLAVRITVGVLCALVAVMIILFTLMILHREGRELMVMEHAIHRLGSLELSADKELEPFYDRTDEIGMIAQIAGQVDNGASQVSASAQALSQGTVEQKDSILFPTNI